MSLSSFRACSKIRTFLFGHRMSIFLPSKHSSCWPLPRRNHHPFHIESLTPGVGVRCPSPSSHVLWRGHRIPPPLLLGLRASLYQPYQMRAQSHWETVRSYAGGRAHLALPTPYRPQRVCTCSSLLDIAWRRSLCPRSPSGSGRRYFGCAGFWGDPHQGLL